MKRKILRVESRWKLAVVWLGGWLLATAPGAAEETYCFRVYLKDKGAAITATDRPETFLSAEAIGRRVKRNVDITLSDVPVAPLCLEMIAAEGCRVVTQSKWLSTVVVESEDSLLIDRLKALPAVDSVLCVWQGVNRRVPEECTEDTSLLSPAYSKSAHEYGYGAGQLTMLHGDRLHGAGKRGQGMRIAVIDAGFLNADRISAFASLRLLGTYNAVFPGHSVFCEDDHGTKVLSCLAACLPGMIIGAAPEASYFLIKSEDSRTEYPIEEDYWAAAVEYADSAGADIISSSLGYYRFDLADTLYRQSDLDGRTAHISRVAQMAADKGLLLVCSAGNEGGHEWEKITFPADASGVLTVGAVMEDGTLSSFSSKGFTADFRVKPDVVALGTGVCVINAEGDIHYTSGTSFSTPVVAGLSACLWQALPWLDNRALIDLIRRTASQAGQPDAERGYGIPNMYNAYISELHEPVQ
jgi:subtilisin family serine protease